MMRRAYILVTLMASVSAIDMAKRGMMLRGKSAEPQEIDRSKCSTICRKRTKLTCAWGKDLAINTEDKSYWCCDLVSDRSQGCELRNAQGHSEGRSNILLQRRYNQERYSCTKISG